jgi:hypothetical protein
MGNMVASEYGIPYAQFLHPNCLQFSAIVLMKCAVICKTTFNCTERTSVCYLSTYWLIGILNFESRISDIESRISNDPSGLS